jgi:transposase-like protein
MQANSNCQTCGSSKVIKHGFSSNNSQRYICKNCGKTFVNYEGMSPKYDIWKLSDSYLEGNSYRELMDIYGSTPQRINQKIRNFLSECPRWENYLDSFMTNQSPKLVFLVGKKFSCSYEDSPENTMFIAYAIDALSYLVLGYEIASFETNACWQNLLKKMNSRNINCSHFISNGSEYIENAVSEYYANASKKISYHKTFRDKELSCCLTRSNVTGKLIYDAVKIYSGIENKNLYSFFSLNDERDLIEILNCNTEIFLNVVKSRLENRQTSKIDAFLSNFQERFEKFHLIKENPEPIINGWIARTMLVKNQNGFSNLSLYMQIPNDATIADFSIGKPPKPMKFRTVSPRSIQFIIEIIARVLELPIITNECELKFQSCVLI